MTGDPLADQRYVSEVLELLWPGHRETSLPSRRGLAMVPPGRPRLVLPRRPGRVAAAALRSYNTAEAGVRRSQLALGAVALRCGAAALVPGGISGGEGIEGIEGELTRILGQEVYVGLYLGPPRIAQKPVLQVLDRRGATLAFAKVGVNARTDALVAHEAHTLGELGRLGGQWLRVPRLLHEGSWRGRRLTVQEAIAGRDHQPVTAALRAAAAAELVAAWRSTYRPLCDSAFAARLLGQVAQLPWTTLGRRLREAVQLAFARTGDVELAFGAAHGDWVPWNMTSDGARLGVWDWEGFAHDVPVGFDELHWRINDAVAIGGVAPRRAVATQVRGAADSLARLTGGGRKAQVTTLWYVLDLVTRYAAEGEDVLGGTPLSRLETWAVPALVPLLQAVQQIDPS